MRFYQTTSQTHADNDDLVEQGYAVTFEDEGEGEKKSFFVIMESLRTHYDDGKADWRLLRAVGGGKPTGWESGGTAPGAPAGQH